MSKVYLAGPGVFRLDAARHGRDLVALAAQMGFEGLYPLDGELGNISGLSGPRSQTGYGSRTRALSVLQTASSLI